MSKRDILPVLALILLALVFVNGMHIESVEEYYGGAAGSVTDSAAGSVTDSASGDATPDDVATENRTVTVSIRCDTVWEHSDDLDPALRSGEYLPADGVILPETVYELRDGDTVFDILQRAVREHRIQMEYQGAELSQFGSVYIQGIQYLYEFSCGPLSGWMYRVNGEFPRYGCSAYKLEDGAVIEWVYTCDLGRDVGCAWLEGSGENV